MKTKRAIVWLLALTYVVSGCGTSGYLTDRRHDLTDVAHVDLNCLALGMAANAGPVVLGGHTITAILGPGMSVRLGLGGVQWIVTDGTCWGIGFPLERYRAGKRSEGGPFGDRRRGRSSRLGNYEQSYPGWGSLGFDVGLLFRRCGKESGIPGSRAQRHPRGVRVVRQKLMVRHCPPKTQEHASSRLEEAQCMGALRHARERVGTVQQQRGARRRL